MRKVVKSGQKGLIKTPGVNGKGSTSSICDLIDQMHLDARFKQGISVRDLVQKRVETLFLETPN